MAWFECSIGSGGDGSTLVVTCFSGFAGLTISCTNGVDTYTETCPSSSPYEVSFSGLSDGTWICYHDDTLSYNDTYIRQSDGSELPSTYVNTAWNTISSTTANSWDWGVSYGDQYKNLKPLTLNTFFITCAKLGIAPVLSIHPFPSSSELEEIRNMAILYNVIDKLELKIPVNESNLNTLYSVFGNRIEAYIVDIASSTSGAAAETAVNDAIGYLNNLRTAGCTVRLGVELFESTAFDAYVNVGITPFQTIANAGYTASLARVNGYYSPTHPSVDSNCTFGADYEYWMSRCVTEFTDPYNYSDGLNW